MRTILVLLFILMSAISAYSQNTSPADTGVASGTEYVPVEGRIVPGVRADLEGKWTLKWGIKPEQPKVSMDLSAKHQGSERVLDSVTHTDTVNGVVTTTTEVNVERTVPQQSKITPVQGTLAHVPERPSISFFGANETFSGFTGCNKFSGRFTLQDNQLRFTAAPSTRMVCIGQYDENAFMAALSRVNGFRTNNGDLELLDGNTIVLVFTRK